jgi:hypothetical protein
MPELTGVDIPLVLCRKLLGQDGNLKDHLLAEPVVGDLEVLEQLGDDLL